jgi:hypothetical protein
MPCEKELFLTLNLSGVSLITSNIFIKVRLMPGRSMPAHGKVLIKERRSKNEAFVKGPFGLGLKSEK